MKTYNVEVFQGRDPGEFYDFEEDEATDEEMFEELRHLRWKEIEDLDFETFGRLYTLVGTESIVTEDPGENAHPDALRKKICKEIFMSWQNHDMECSDIFRESNDQRRATSLKVGDIVRVNGVAYRCEPYSWERVDALSYGGEN